MDNFEVLVSSTILAFQLLTLPKLWRFLFLEISQNLESFEKDYLDLCHCMQNRSLFVSALKIQDLAPLFMILHYHRKNFEDFYKEN